MAFTRPKAAQIDFDITNITDPLIRLNSGQSGANDKDVGIVIERGNDTNVAIIYDESADQFVLVNTTETGSTSGNVTISSYADLKVGQLETTGNVTVGGDLTVTGTTTTVDVASINITNSFSFEGATANGFETTLTVADPTADRTITLPDVTGYAAIFQSNPGTTLVTATATELNYVDGVTSNIQTQLDGKLTGNQTITLSGDVTGSGTTAITTTIAANSVGADELNVSGNGTAGYVLVSDGDGSFSWSVGGGGGSGHTIQNAGSDLTARTNLNFDGTYLVATDDAGNDQTDITIGSGVVTTTGTQTLTNKTLTSPTFTGTPAAPTAAAGTNTTQIATTAFVSTAVSNLVDSAPGTLDTLNELAAALGDDANFSTTVTNSIATKLPLAGGTMSGNIVMSGAQTVDGRDLSVDGAKLDGIESGATADQTASEILTAIKTVDGSGSGLDADTLDGQQGSYYAPIASPTFTGTVTYYSLSGPAASTRDKIRVWSSSAYAIGMGSGYTFGALNDFAMTFQMNDDADRGWWWGHSVHTNDQGAMSLTTDGELTVAKSISIPGSETATSGSTGLYMFDDGNPHIHGDNNLWINSTSGNLYLNNQNSGNIIMTNGTGKVGIGTAAPAVELEIASSQPELRLTDTDGTDQESTFVQAGGTLYLNLQNNTSDGAFRVRGFASGSATDHFLVNGSGNVGIGTVSPGTALEVNGTVTATDVDISSSLNIGSEIVLTESTDRADLLLIKSTTSTWGGIQISNSSNEGLWSFMTDGATGGIYDDQNNKWHVQFVENSETRLYHNGVEKLNTDSGGVTVSGVMTGTATSARYADLAERYEADAEYPTGTVMIFGGEKEVTQSTSKMDRRKAGVVSEKPAYMMNSDLVETVEYAPYIALQGRVPVRVIGEVRKGDLMITSSLPGCAEAWREEGDPRYGSVIGKALANKTTTEEELIEVVVGVI